MSTKSGLQTYFGLMTRATAPNTKQEVVLRLRTRNLKTFVSENYNESLQTCCSCRRHNFGKCRRATFKLLSPLDSVTNLQQGYIFIARLVKYKITKKRKVIVTASVFYTINE